MESIHIIANFVALIMMYPEPVPKGFIVEQLDHSTILIHHQRTGMEALNVFLGVWLTGWTVGCVGILHEFLAQTPMGNGDPIPLGIVMGFWTGEIVVLCCLIYLLFCKQSFQLDAVNLTIETKLLSLQWRTTIPKDSIHKLMQVQDGGRGRDSFLSWGLVLKGRKTAQLIVRQPYNKSYWLGQVLADWAKVPFIEAPQKNIRFGR